MAQNATARPVGSINGIDLVGETVVNTYNEITSVAASGTADVVSYTVPVGKTFLLTWVEGNGNNIASYEVDIGGSTVAKKHTYFGSSLYADFNFGISLNRGLSVSSGTIIKLIVTNFRSEIGDFEGRILGVLKD